MRVCSRSLNKPFSEHPDERSWLLDRQQSLTALAQVVRLVHLSATNKSLLVQISVEQNPIL